MLFEKKRVLRKDNRGLSLVELLVAMAIGTVVSASIASLLVFSLRMYGNQTVDVQMQQEIQTTSNIIIDAIMESESFIVDKSKDSADKGLVDTVILGSFEYDSISSELKYSGYVFCSDNVDSTTKDGKLYMKRYPSSNIFSLGDDCVVDGYIVPGKVIEKLRSGVAGENANLLAVNVQEFNLTPGDGSITGDKYNNPFLVDVDLKFSKSGGIRDVRKELHDTVAIRNTLKAIYKKDSTTEVTPVCVINGDGSVNMYNQPDLTSKVNSGDVLELSTETIQMEKVLGDISYREEGNDGDFTILEIIPSYRCDYIQYALGGLEGHFLDDVNIHYADPSFDRVTSDEIDAYFQSADEMGFFTNNNNPYLAGMRKYTNNSNVGYYEYVGQNKGVYAIERLYYDGVYRFAENTENKTLYRISSIEDADYDGDYNEIIKTIQPDPTNPYWTYSSSIYEYNSYGTGSKNVEFKLCDWGCTDNKAELHYYLDNTNPICVKEVDMYTRYTAPSTEGLDFGWVWHDANEISSLLSDDIYYGSLYTLKDEIEESQRTGFRLNQRIYLKNHKKSKIINNDLFKLFVLGDSVKKYTLNNALDTTKGIWDANWEGDHWSGEDKYNTINYEAIKQWNQNHKVTLYVCTPEDVDRMRVNNEPVDVINKADLIVFSCPADGGFHSANILYSNIKKLPIIEKDSFDGGDLTFDDVEKIYNRVIDNEAAIVCNAKMDGYKTNISRLMSMLYFCKKADVTMAQAISDTLKEGSVLYDVQKNFVTTDFSGREVFRGKTDLIKQSSSEYAKGFSNVLREKIYPNSNYIHLNAIQQDGVYMNQVCYNDNSSLLSFNTDGRMGLFSIQAALKEVGEGGSGAKVSFGELEIVGISLDGDNGRYVPGQDPQNGIAWGWPGKKYSKMNISYQIDVVTLPTAVEIQDGKEKVKINKVVYLNEYEYEYAKTHESRVFCIVHCTDEYPSFFLNEMCVPVHYIGDYEKEKNTNPNYYPFGKCPFDACQEKVGLASVYDAEDFKDSIDGKPVKYVMECQVDMNITEGTAAGVDTNVFGKYIKIQATMDPNPAHASDRRPLYPTGEKKNVAVGTDYAFVVVRDLFDLD